MSVLHGIDFLDKLKRTGVVPHNTKRVVIDASFNDVVHVYYECFGDVSLLSLDTVEPLKDCVTLHVEDLADK